MNFAHDQRLNGREFDFQPGEGGLPNSLFHHSLRAPNQIAEQFVLRVEPDRNTAFDLVQGCRPTLTSAAPGLRQDQLPKRRGFTWDD
ncbi:hypothetical protein KFU94_37010 [Chloroflexi bacterium TSY]|nr:hypothetical protein [Chloroflexi bacterium TSY]